MPIDINVQAEDRLAQLVKHAVAGEEIILERNGESVAKLVPLKQGNRKPRRGGQWKGRVKIAEDFDELPESFMSVFRGEDEWTCHGSLSTYLTAHDSRLKAYNVPIPEA